MSKTTILKPNLAVLDFLEKAKHLVSKMPYWKRGVLTALTLSSNSTARPTIDEKEEQEG